MACSLMERLMHAGAPAALLQVRGHNSSRDAAAAARAPHCSSGTQQAAGVAWLASREVATTRHLCPSPPRQARCVMDSRAGPGRRCSTACTRRCRPSPARASTPPAWWTAWTRRSGPPPRACAGPCPPRPSSSSTAEQTRSEDAQVVPRACTAAPAAACCGKQGLPALCNGQWPVLWCLVAVGAGVVSERQQEQRGRGARVRAGAGRAACGGRPAAPRHWAHLPVHRPGEPQTSAPV